MAPNSLHFVERGLAAMDDSGLPDASKLQVIGLLSSYTLSEARMAADAMREAKAALAASPGADGSPGPPQSYQALLRELVDEQTYPHLYRLAWQPEPEHPLSEREQYMLGLDTIPDGVQALIDRAAGGY